MRIEDAKELVKKCCSDQSKIVKVEPQISHKGESLTYVETLQGLYWFKKEELFKKIQKEKANV